MLPSGEQAAHPFVTLIHKKNATGDNWFHNLVMAERSAKRASGELDIPYQLKEPLQCHANPHLSWCIHHTYIVADRQRQADGGHHTGQHQVERPSRFIIVDLREVLMLIGYLKRTSSSLRLVALRKHSDDIHHYNIF